MEYVLLFALVAVITVSSATFLTELRCQQVPQAFCRATKTMLSGDPHDCASLNACVSR